ncbi:MAG: nucleotidyl transferase AbiEii/AbiGii toxin family protein [Nitrospiria bacterium]
MPNLIFKTAGAFRQSLEERLNQISRNQGLDLERLRRKVAFERLLARLFANPHPPWVLKGGYGIELRFPKLARATKDIDFSIPDPTQLISQGKSPTQEIRERLQEELEKDLGDWLVFLLGEQTDDLRTAPLGGFRFSVKTELDRRVFVQFKLDIGVGDVLLTEIDWITGHELLSFAGIPPARVAVIPLDQQFAEKIHAYTLPRERENSRTRDLIDLVLLIDQGLPPKVRVLKALRATFEHRATHPLPLKLEPPPESWAKSYSELAVDYDSQINTIGAAYQFISDYWGTLGVS